MFVELGHVFILCNLFYEVLVLNILVLGNGFDKLHGLPTGYRDFLDCVVLSKKIYNEYGMSHYYTNDYLEFYIRDIQKKDIKTETETVFINMYSEEPKGMSDEITSVLTH